MILIYSVFLSFLATIIGKCILFRLFKFDKKNWAYFTLFFFLVSSTLIFLQIEINHLVVEYILTHLLFLICLILFLTMVYNDSPSIYFLQNIIIKNLKLKFLKKKFVSNRLKLLKEKKLISSKKIFTKKGILLNAFVILLSEIFINDNN